MNKLLIVCASMILIGCAHRPVANPVDLTPAIHSVDKIDESLTRIGKSNDKQQIKQIVVEAKQEIQTARQSLFTQQKLAEQMAANRDWWKDYSSKQEGEIVALKKKLVHFNHLLFAVSTLAGILVGLVIGRLAMAFSPYGIVIGIIAGGITFGSTWAVLSHL